MSTTYKCSYCELEVSEENFVVEDNLCVDCAFELLSDSTSGFIFDEENGLDEYFNKDEYDY